MKRAIFLALSLWTTLSCNDPKEDESPGYPIFFADFSDGFEERYRQPTNSYAFIGHWVWRDKTGYGKKKNIFTLPKNGVKGEYEIKALKDGIFEIFGRMNRRENNYSDKVTISVYIGESHEQDISEPTKFKTDAYDSEYRKYRKLSTADFMGKQIEVKEGDILTFRLSKNDDHASSPDNKVFFSLEKVAVGFNPTSPPQKETN